MRPTPERIRELVNYDPLTGYITRKFNGCGIVTGKTAKLDGAVYRTADIAWVYYYGEWPKSMLDHKDRSPWNDKIENLRECNHSQNGMNLTQYNPTGFKGVYKSGRLGKPWQAQIRIGGIKTNLGRFKTLDEAREAYLLAALEHHGEFACLE